VKIFSKQLIDFLEAAVRLARSKWAEDSGSWGLPGKSGNINWISYGRKLRQRLNICCVVIEMIVHIVSKFSKLHSGLTKVCIYI
jgi:hypothetical protein